MFYLLYVYIYIVIYLYVIYIYIYDVIHIDIPCICYMSDSCLIYIYIHTITTSFIVFTRPINQANNKHIMLCFFVSSEATRRSTSRPRQPHSQNHVLEGLFQAFLGPGRHMAKIMPWNVYFLHFRPMQPNS